MNITTSYSPINSRVAPIKVGSSAHPHLSIAASTKSNEQSSLSLVSSPSTIADPTYSKPTINSADHVSKQESGQALEQSTDSPFAKQGGTTTSDTPEEEQDATIKVADGREQKHQDNETYSEAELDLISELKMRDSEVIAHERAHAAVGGQHAGSPSYSYKTGPDGVKYAVSGEVSIDTSRIPGDPQATLRKAQQIKAAALAPAEPSGQDRKVAAKADQMASQARREILEINNTDEDTKQSPSHPHSETNVPEHFTREQNLSSIDNNAENNDSIQNLMNERRFHINELYQRSTSVSAASNLDIQV